MKFEVQYFCLVSRVYFRWKSKIWISNPYLCLVQSFYELLWSSQFWKCLLTCDLKKLMEKIIHFSNSTLSIKNAAVKQTVSGKWSCVNSMDEFWKLMITYEIPCNLKESMDIRGPTNHSFFPLHDLFSKFYFIILDDIRTQKYLWRAIISLVQCVVKLVLEAEHIQIVEKAIDYTTQNERNRYLQGKENQILKNNAMRNDKKCQKK